MNGYKAFCRGKQAIEVYANSVLAAQEQAGRVWNLKPSQWHKITVVLCEKNGETVTHSTASL